MLLPSAFGDDGFVKHHASGCSVFKPNLKSTESVAWTGSCVDGFAKGQGIANWLASDGSSVTFAGQFVQGKLQGEGKMTASGGDRYEGTYKDGKRDGLGTYISAKGDRYQGQYKENQRHGHGVLTLASGQRVEGEWRNGVQTSTGPATPSSTDTARPTESTQKPIGETKAEQPEVQAQPKLESRPSPDAVGTQSAVPLVTPRQRAQQQLVERQEQEKLERESVQAQQDRLLAERHAALVRECQFNTTLFWLLICSPILLALLVWKIEWKAALHANHKMQAWIEASTVRANRASGSFSKYVRRPFLWGLGMSFNLSSSIANQYLQAGVRLAACLYLVGAFITLAIWITAFVVFIAMLIVILVIGGPLIREVRR